jgi:hypothetical protein
VLRRDEDTSFGGPGRGAAGEEEGRGRVLGRGQEGAQESGGGAGGRIEARVFGAADGGGPAHVVSPCVPVRILMTTLVGNFEPQKISPRLYSGCGTLCSGFEIRNWTCFSILLIGGGLADAVSPCFFVPA